MMKLASAVQNGDPDQFGAFVIPAPRLRGRLTETSGCSAIDLHRVVRLEDSQFCLT